MGGSGGHHGGGGGGIYVDEENCGGEFPFQVTITAGTEKTVWNNCAIDDVVIIKSTEDKVPKMFVVREHDDFLIGVVPASASGLINCIKKGWKYRGKIISKSGNEYNPLISVIVKGEK